MHAAGERDEDYDFIFKLVLIGDQGTGKSNIMSRFTRNEFTESNNTTIGVEFGSKTIVTEGKSVKAQIWDTAGQERFRTITKAYYRGAVGALLLYDITRKSTFEGAKSWLTELRQNADPKAIIMLVGNKRDLQQQREVSMAEAEEFSKRERLLYIETSARDSTNVEEAFKQVLTQLYHQLSKPMMEQSDSGQHSPAPATQVSRIDLQKGKKSKRSSCCSS